MADLAALLKDQIRRLARSEARRELEPLRRASANYRRDVAALKRELADTQRTLAILESEQRRAQKGAAAAVAGDLESRRFSAKGLRSHRKRLDLSAEDYGKLVGVSGQTIYNWELGKARPTGEAFARIIELRKLGKRAALRRLNTLA